MQTAELLDLMGALKLRGMRSAFEETLSEGLKRKHSFHQIIAKLLASEAEERRLRNLRKANRRNCKNDHQHHGPKVLAAMEKGRTAARHQKLR